MMTSFFKNKSQELLFISTILLAFITFYIETDIYTPSFPQMMEHFKTDEKGIQLLLSMNFFGLCLSALFFGPASDAYGRKPILCTGLTLFMLSSLGCAITDSLEWMVFYRFIQGLGCGAIASAGCTLFFDIYPPSDSSRLISVCNGTVGGMMALAPLLGNWISLHWGWRTNFYLIAFLAVVSCVFIWIFIKETLPREKRIQMSVLNVCKNYGEILQNFPFMAHSFIWCLGFSLVILYIANLSLIFVDHLQVPIEDFGYYQTAVMGLYFLGSMSGAYLIKYAGPFNTKILGSLIYISGVVILGYLSLTHLEIPVYLISAMALISLGSAVAMTIFFTYSMTYLGDHLKGSAMALTQSLRLVLSSGLVWIASVAFDGTTKPLTYLSLGSLAICLGLYLMLYFRKQHASHDQMTKMSVFTKYDQNALS